MKNLRKINKKSIVTSTVPYLYLFLVAIACNLVFILSDKYFAMGHSDSVTQYMVFMPFLQEAFLSGEMFWSFSNGLGGDIFSQFSNYYTSSPFFYLSVILRALGIGSWGLTTVLKWKLLTCILKQFLAMSFMYALMRYQSKTKFLSLLSAITYGASLYIVGYSLPFDTMPECMVWLPLTIFGILRIEKENKKGLFIIGAMLSVATSFYFGYMSFIFYGIFILIMVPIVGSTVKERAFSLFKTVKKYFLLIMLSMGLACITFLPAVYALTHSDRLGLPYIVPILPSKEFIFNAPEQFFLKSSYMGFPLLCLVLVFCSFKMFSPLAKRSTVLALLFVGLYFIPFVSSMFNGFSYMTDRWYYLIIFSVSFALPHWVEQIMLRKNISIVKISGLALVIGIYFVTQKYYSDIYYIFMLVLGLLSIAIVLAFKHISKPKLKQLAYAAIILCVSSTLIVNNISRCLGSYSLYISYDELSSYKGLNYSYESEIFNQLRPSTDEFYRTDFYILDSENSPIAYDYYGTSGYVSLLDGNISQWVKKDAQIYNYYVSPSRHFGFDDRLYLQTLFGVKYKVVEDIAPFSSPYYTEIARQNGYIVYENENALPIGFWYDSTISSEYYSSQNIAARDALPMYGAVTDTEIEGLPTIEPKPDTKELSLNMANAEVNNIERSGNIISAGEDASITVPISGNDLNAGEILFSIGIRSNNDDVGFKLTVNEKEVNKLYAKYKWNYPVDEYTFRLDGSTEELRITISPGDFTLDKVTIYKNNYTNYEQQVTDLKENELQNLYVNGGTVTGQITNEEKGMLALSIPYSEGWHATVNGEPAEIMQVNSVMSGIVLEPGTHDIELHYVTPHFYLGVAVSSVSLCVFILVMIFQKIKRKPIVIY